MSIKYAILGLVKLATYVGLRPKKDHRRIMTFYWSGNNNQIYNSLVSLHTEGLVDIEEQHGQEN